METAKPKIACLSNGPYYLLNDSEPRVIPNIQKSSGEACVTITGVALCRCGGSGNKPFCDGTHGKMGFSDANLSDGTHNQRINYVGKQITIHDNHGICSHAGHCTDNLKSVFRLHEAPWIDPDGAAAEAIIHTVKQCPSGALSYSVGNIEHRDQDRAPMVTVTKNGPYAVTCGIALLGQSFGAALPPNTSRFAVAAHPKTSHSAMANIGQSGSRTIIIRLCE